MPKIQEILSSISGSKYFSLIDLRSAYHQVKLSKNSKDYTIFVTPVGSFRFVRLPFGLASSASVFQKLMEHILKGLQGVEKLQDDILIHASTIEEHNNILDKVLFKLNEKGMTVAKHKCKFLQCEIEYLGHCISGDGIKPKLDLTKAIVDAPNPDDKDSLRSFLGLSEYYARFIENYAYIVEPLRNLLRKGVKFFWSPKQDRAFYEIKKAIANVSTLHPFDSDSKNIVTVDASAIGIGAIFTQKKKDAIYTVAFISRRLHDSELHYSTIEGDTGLHLGCRKIKNVFVG